MSEKAYTTYQKVASFLGVTIASGDQATVTAWCLGISRMMDQMANRVLFNDEEETIAYDGDGMGLLVINDVVDISEVTLDGSPVDVLEYPTNKPYTSRIVLEEGQRFTKGKQNVTVTGIHAMSKTLPPDVEMAATILVALIYSTYHTEADEGVVTGEKIGNYSFTLRTSQEKKDYQNALSIINSYRRIAV